MTLLYKAFGEVGNNTLNSVNSLNKKAPFGAFLLSILSKTLSGDYLKQFIEIIFLFWYLLQR
jgi:hypothetical protein